MAKAEEQWNSEELKELRKVFFAQAYETVDTLEDAMLALEADPADGETLKIVKRHVHTLKGDSNSIGLGAIGTLCHRMEDVLSVLLGGGEGHEAVELLMACVDSLYGLLVKSEAGDDGASADAVLARIERVLGGAGAPAAPAPRPVPTEYEELELRDARAAGLALYEVEAVFHPQCGEKNVAARMVLQRLAGLGRIVRAAPDPERENLASAPGITVLIGTDRDAESLTRETTITGITSRAAARRFRDRETGTRPAESGTNAPAGAPPAPQAARRSETLRIDAVKVDRVMDLVGELIIGRSMVEEVMREIGTGRAPQDAAAKLYAVNSYLERTVSDIQKGVMKMRMVPVHHVFRKFPKMVRDLSVERGKRVRLELRGTETELDKGIVDALGEPLAHIVRNFIDHGIERPEERREAGKPEEGTVTLRAYHEAAQIVIEAGDDGRGIDTEKLRRTAVEKGFLAAGDAGRMTEAEAVNLIFISGLSTAETVTETSGRGVGMDAVRNAVEVMKGLIEVESGRGRGTLFRMRLPLTLAVIKALLFEVGERLYAVPVAAVAEVTKIMTDELTTVDGKKTLVLRDRVVSILSLEEVFSVSGNGKQKKFVLILAAGGRRAGLMIDRLLWQQELVIKAVDGARSRSDLVAGASILGSGKVVLILDAAAVFRKAVDDERRKLAAV